MYYNSSDAHYVDELRNAGWSDSVIQKYLDYRMDRKMTIRRGRSAFKDSMQSRVYEAEAQFHYNAGYGHKYKNITECEKYVKQVTKSKLWASLCGGDRKVITVSNSSMRRYAGIAYGSHIKLAPSGYNQYTILHELAHCCGNMHHDISFRQDLLKLVSRFMGREQAKVLKKAFKTHGLKLSMKQSVKEPQVWLRQYERLTKVRQEKESV